MAENMYTNTKTWNPFKGCEFDCTYCEPSFKRQAKRIGKKGCQDCFHFQPHCHEDRLATIPSAANIFVCSMGDISFCPPEFMWRIIASINHHLIRCPDKTFLFQSKRPGYFTPFLAGLPANNVILGTTVETNWDAGYRSVSKAPLPSERIADFWLLSYPRKFLTIEPVMEFIEPHFAREIIALRPQHVWIGFNSRPKPQLPEPSPEKVMELMQRLVDAGIKVRGKNLRGLKVPEPTETEG